MPSNARAGAPRTRLARRACDACKIRKIKCSEGSPCDGCVESGIECTFIKKQATRGPKGLRRGTVERIVGTKSPHVDGTPLRLADIIDIYARRLYSLWPIVDAAELKEAVVSGLIPPGSSLQRLADAVALATVAQLKLTTDWTATAQHCRRSDDAHDDGQTNPLDELRISFFLHVYYENLVGGGMSSMLYLREAITHAQMLKLEYESTYAMMLEPEQHLYRRVFWLLFVTERGVTLLHKLPSVLKTNIFLPWYGVADSIATIFPDFLRLVHLFWIFDQSGIFDMLRTAEADSSGSSQRPLYESCLVTLQQNLQESSRFVPWASANDIQRADVLVTREWMCAVLWRAALRFGIVLAALNPVDVGRRYLDLVSQIPASVLESHGPTLEFKTYEIATAVIDAMSMRSDGPDPELNQVLDGLHDLLTRSRGGNAKLLSLLDTKMSALKSSLTLQEPQSVEKFIQDMLLSIDDQGNWRCEDFFPQLQLDLAALSTPLADLT